MNGSLHELLDDFSAGRLTRRDLIRGLAAAAATGLLAREVAAQETLPSTPPAPSLFHATSLNHIAFRVSDLDETQAFYQRVLGAKLMHNEPKERIRFLAIGPHVVNLFRADAPAFDHLCFTVDDYTPASARKRLAEAGVEPIARDERTYFIDPNGFQLQVGGPNAGGQEPWQLALRPA